MNQHQFTAMGAPLVSVLICSYNAASFIESTIRSVLAQTYPNLEILVLDNHSEDGTVEMLERIGREEPRLKLHAGRENIGAYGGLNYLLQRASGAYIAINDHDDLWHRDKIRRQVEFLEQHTQYVGCGTAIINHYEKYKVFLLRRQHTVSTSAWHTSLVYRNTGQSYDDQLKVATDFHFMKNILCARKKLIYNMTDPMVLRRIRADRTNLSSKWIRFANAKAILCVRLGLLDKLALLNRLLIPEAVADYLIIKVLLRKRILPPGDPVNHAILREFAGIVV